MKTYKDPKKPVRASTGLSGRNLTRALKTAGVSKYRLAKDLGISYRIVQYWARGRRPSAAMAERVAAYLGIQAEPESITALEVRVKKVEADLAAINKHLIKAKKEG